MNKSLISVIVPVYNIEKYVSECIESIMQQTYQNLQIILVDDGSTDKSGEICEEYASLDKRIEVIHQQNGGLVVARKKGLEKAKGEYIGFVDGDDYIEPNMYQMLYDEIIKNSADIVHSALGTKNEKRLVYKKELKEFLSRSDKEKFLTTAVFGTQKYIEHSMCIKLFKSELVKESYSYVLNNMPYGEDLINFLICIMSCNKVVLLDEGYYHYRFRRDSISNKEELKSLWNVLNLYENVCDVLAKFDCSVELKSSIIKYIYSILLFKIDALSQNDFQIAKYYFADADLLQGKNVIIYGAGMVGKDYYAQISRYSRCNIIAWADTYPEKYNYPYIHLYGMNDLQTLDFDILVIAIKEEETAKSIQEELMLKGIDESKIIWSDPVMYADKIELLS